jgi:hypothetical protein
MENLLHAPPVIAVSRATMSTPEQFRDETGEKMTESAMKIWTIWVAAERVSHGAPTMPVLPTPASEERPSSPWQDRWPAPTDGTAVRTCQFSISSNRSRKLSDGGLHTPDAWSWLRDTLFAEVGEGLVDIPQFFSVKRSEGGGGVKVRLTLVASAVGRLREILEEACERFHRKRIRVVFRDRHNVMEVWHR